MLDTYLIATAVFFGVVIFLVGALLLVESKVVLKGDRKIVINDNPDNENDRDRLNTRTDLKLISDPWEWFRVEVAGAYVYTQEINIDASRVNANQNTDLYEVRSNLILDPEGGWRFVQNYRLQIRIIDRLVGIAGDFVPAREAFGARFVWDLVRA